MSTIDEIKSPLPSREVPQQSRDESSESIVPPVVEENIPKRENIVPIVEVPKVKKSLPGYIWALAIGAVLVLIGLVVWKLVLPGLAGKPLPGKQTTITYWGMWESGPIMDGVIRDFEAKNPNIKINYKMQSKQDYRQRLQNRIEKAPEAGVEVPDIFRIHVSWLPMFGANLAAVPASSAKSMGLATDFYKAFDQLKDKSGNYLGVPLMYDQLALFYNKQILEAAQASIPKTWWGFRKLAKQLTVVNPTTNAIQVAGAAMGTAGNVDHWSDILGLLMQQNGVDPFSAEPAEIAKLQDVLTFYSLFETNDKVWDENQENSTLAFAKGKLALYFAPSWRILDIETLNPDLKFEVTNVPQLPTIAGIEDKIERGESADLTNRQWSTYWIEGVNAKSKNQAAAWKFMEYLASKEGLLKLHASAKQVRSFGELYPRKDMAQLLASNTKLTPFLAGADNGKNWYTSSLTWDSTGLVDEMNKYFEDAVNGLSQGLRVEEVSTKLTNGLLRLKNQYRLSDKP